MPYCRRQSFQHRSIQFAIAAVTMALAITWAMEGAPGWTADGASVAQGGRLYENWFLEIRGRPPPEINPKNKDARPSMHSAGNSWLCVTCHGWDYTGRAEQETGALGGEAGTDPISLAAILADEDHTYMSDSGLPGDQAGSHGLDRNPWYKLAPKSPAPPMDTTT